MYIQNLLIARKDWYDTHEAKQAESKYPQVFSGLAPEPMTDEEKERGRFISPSQRERIDFRARIMAVAVLADRLDFDKYQLITKDFTKAYLLQVWGNLKKNNPPVYKTVKEEKTVERDLYALRITDEWEELESGIPDDAVLLYTDYPPPHKVIYFYCHSESFPPHKTCEPYPKIYVEGHTVLSDPTVLEVEKANGEWRRAVEKGVLPLPEEFSYEREKNKYPAHWIQKGAAKVYTPKKAL